MSTNDTDPAAQDAVNELSVAVERAASKSRGTDAAAGGGGSAEPAGSQEPDRAAELPVDSATTDVAADLPAGEQISQGARHVAPVGGASAHVPSLSKTPDATHSDVDSAVTTADTVTGSRKRPLHRLSAAIGRRDGQRPGMRVLVARCAVALLLVAGAASTLYFYMQDRDKEAVLAAQEEARQAACAYAPVLANYDAKNLDPYFRAVLDGATGDWRQQFEATSQELREVLAQGQVVSAASDVQCAIKSGDQTSAEAIVVIGQTITSLGTQGQPAPGQLSMVMRMEKSGDRWLVNDMNAPLAPSSRP
ncbi:hypothetical protein [Nocardia cyriacigeorgica]|uniref:hypothetical protein n=1 Tax=Nocardia cyriacigeorgica TaxID=135487 RepID=UPI001E4993DF|nr:hypothetical protein [Nocardia cyriacigeorgica]